MRLKTSVFVLVILCLSGCGREDSNTSIPQNAYRLEAEDLVDVKGMVLVKRLVITAHGERAVRISVVDGGHREAVVSPDPRADNDLVTADVIILADLIELSASESKLLRWLTQVKGPGITAGGPSLYEVPSTSTLKDIVTLNIQPGEHPVGQPLVLGRLRGKDILLTVKLRKATVLEVDSGIVETNLTLDKASQAAQAYIKEQRWSTTVDDSNTTVRTDAPWLIWHRARTTDGDEIAFELRARRPGPQGDTPSLPTTVYITKNRDSGQLEMAKEFAAYLEKRFGPTL